MMTDSPRSLLAPLLLAGAVLLAPLAAQAQAPERSGKDVVDAYCVKCHGKGEGGAPRIGDNKAWSKRASQGLTSLTDHALKGIRNMPSHGGKLDLTDLEIGRAVTYMVNQSGGKWKEPASVKDMAAERSGKQVVDAQCAKCHAKGEGGAPKIGDRAAWAPRMKQGMDALVLSAIRGHGGMPARGDKADLTDGEIKAAVNYMFNPSSGAPAKAAPAKAAADDRTHKLVAGTDIYLGVIPADKMRARQAGADGKSQPPVPSGKGYVHVSVALQDNASKTDVRDAQVEARVANPMTGETKKLEPGAGGAAGTYGNYFQLTGSDPYTVTLQIRRPGASAPIEAKFDLRR